MTRQRKAMEKAMKAGGNEWRGNASPNDVVAALLALKHSPREGPEDWGMNGAAAAALGLRPISGRDRAASYIHDHLLGPCHNDALYALVDAVFSAEDQEK